MTKEDPEFWARVVDAREELVQQCADDPDVLLIDIGYPPETCANAEEVVVRVHVTEEWFEKNPDGDCALPETLDEIPVCIVCHNE